MKMKEKIAQISGVEEVREQELLGNYQLMSVYIKAGKVIRMSEFQNIDPCATIGALPDGRLIMSIVVEKE